MRKTLGAAAIVIGVGLFMFGASGFTGGGRYPAGWDQSSQMLMALGAMLTVAGQLVRR